MTKVISYYRVSTSKQKRSGLGLLAQRQIIEHYTEKLGLEIVGEYIETQTAKELESRGELQKALATCRKNNYTLIVAKLDRLSRDVEHTFKIIRELGEGKLISCDLPSTDSLTVSIFAGLAQREREIISIRTKQALAEKKRQGVKLGKPQNFTQAGRTKGVKVLKLKAEKNPNNKRAIPMIREYRKNGLSLQKIANELNENGFLTSRGKKFQKTTVKRLIGSN